MHFSKPFIDTIATVHIPHDAPLYLARELSMQTRTQEPATTPTPGTGICIGTDR
jgi:hypothetical protein